MQNERWQVISELDDGHVADLVALYAVQWWSAGRDADGVRRMLAHSPMVIGVVEGDSGRLVAFCRALSDGVYRACIYDVMVDETHQNEGLGRLLMDQLTSHPMIKGVQRVELVCYPDIAPFYEKWGFAEVPPDWVMMVLGARP